MLKAGIVGLGTMGHKYTQLIVQDPRTVLAAVYDVNAERVKAASQQYQVPGFTNLSDFLKVDMDFVYVSTPDWAHVEPAVRAAERGLHLLIEKPLATSTAEAELIVQAVRKNKVKAKVCFCNRWNPPFVAAKRAIDCGEIGDVLSVYARLNDTIYVPTKMLKWANQSSPGWFLMSHTLDLARWFIGADAVEVFGIGQKKVLKYKYGIDTYDNLYAVVRFKNEALAVLESGWILPESFPLIIDFKVEIVGTQGCIHIDTHDQMLHIAANKYQHLPTMDIEVNGRLRGQVAMNFEEFVDSLLEDRDPAVGVEDGLENTRVLEAVHRAADSGGSILKVGGSNA